MIAELRAAPDRVGSFVAPDDDADVPAGEICDLDKAWHAIHFLLSGGDSIASGPGGSLFAGEELGEDFGYGSARLLTPPQVEAFAEYLASKPDDFVEREFDFTALEAADIYPNIWDRKDPEDIAYVADNFRELKGFARASAAAGDGIFILLM